jgi:energy-coupling factor transporter transmembrane protein EcfT
LPPGIKISIYAAFVACLFLTGDIALYLFFIAAVLVFLLRLPAKSLRSGLVPISIFLLFTFISHLMFQQGRVLCSIGPFVLTAEGLEMAFIKTMRVFLMIAGAKILTWSAPVELLVESLGKIFKPLEYLGVPVAGFFTTMGLTMKALPGLKTQMAETYSECLRASRVRNFSDRANVMAGFIVSLLVKSIRSPGSFFRENESGRNIRGK